MSKRSISSLEDKEAVPEKNAEEKIIKEPPQNLTLVSLNYPKGVWISSLIEDVARWSHYNFIFEPSLNRQIQIFAPHRIPQDEAFSLFISSLETSGLRVVVVDGSSVVKIVESALKKAI